MAFQAAARKNIAYLQSRYSQIQCDVVRVAPTALTGEMGSMNVDLWAMNRAVNTFRQGHINLRLVREQLARLQNTEIKLPVQLLTLIDRSIAKGVHYW